jgi:hypothetical protein
MLIRSFSSALVIGVMTSISEQILLNAISTEVPAVFGVLKNINCLECDKIMRYV